jgi:hypothetical protein
VFEALQGDSDTETEETTEKAPEPEEGTESKQEASPKEENKE